MKDKMKRYLCLFAIIGFYTACITSGTQAAEKTEINPKVWLVEIDSKSVAKFGKFPWSREKYANLIQRISAGTPRLIVIKLFLDQLKSPEEDKKLASEIQRAKNIILQARLSNDDEPPTRLNNRFGLKNPIKHYSDPYKIFILRAASGWIPAPIFQEHALDVGFVDILSPDNLKGIPLVVDYERAISDTRGWSFASLPLAIFRQYYQLKDFRLRHDPKLMTVDIAGHTVAVAENQEIKIDWSYVDKIKTKSVVDVLSKEFDPNIFRDSVIIIGYGGSEMPRAKLSNGQNVDGNRIIAAATLHLLTQYKPKGKM